MVAPRRKDLIRQRRRLEDEGEEEEEEGSTGAAVEDDSLSEGSIISDADDDADAEGSDGSEAVPSEGKDDKQKNGINASREILQDSGNGTSAPATKTPFSTVMGDTDAMINGLKLSGEADEGEEINFEDLGKVTEATAHDALPSQQTNVATPSNTLGERRLREHEEYKKKRDADPTFVPNRGGFFMHDHRSDAPGQNGFRPFGRGRGRGRGVAASPFSSTNQSSQPTDLADAPWAHDLHETIAESGPKSLARAEVASLSQKPPQARVQPPNRSFSASVQTGNVQIRVYMAGMSSPITVSAVPVYSHTRLPHHRPPLRRDKPVRISIPEMQIRYIFPSVDRSFVFIPRALRPNQQGFGRVRGRGSFSGGYGGFSSRRTSAYAGSAYSPSVVMSRRSSMAREVSTEALISPTSASFQRLPVTVAEPSKPIVRLPPATEQSQTSSQDVVPDRQVVATANLPQPTAYPPPEDPTFRENRPAPLPMHQPRPQKNVSVADIESPAFNPPQQQQQQPFHQQMPLQMSSQPYQPEAPLYPHFRHPSHPSQESGGTPLSQIPERAIHAQPFQPYAFQQPPAFYPHQYPPPVFFYPPTAPNQQSQPSATAPAFIPGQPYAYPITVAPPPPPLAEPTTQPGTVAHESNGMVYYYDPSQLAVNPDLSQSYPPPGYTMPPPGDGVGVMTPVHYYPQPSAAPFYPAQ